MLGLNRLDEDVIALLEQPQSASATSPKARQSEVLRPATIQPYPTDPIRREEYRRTFWAVFIMDKFESATVGWRSIVDESYLRVLLPCDERSFELGDCDRSLPGRHLATAWPTDMNDPHDELVSPFGWICRLALILGRMTVSRESPCFPLSEMIFTCSEIHLSTYWTWTGRTACLGAERRTRIDRCTSCGAGQSFEMGRSCN